MSFHPILIKKKTLTFMHRLYSLTFRFSPFLLTLLCLSACSPASVVNFLTPRGDFDVVKNIHYGSADRQVFDVYTPSNVTPNQAVIVFVHGGSWASGSKNDYLFVGQAFSEMGFVTVVPNYRLYPDVEFPEFVEDIAQAIAKLPELLPTNKCVDPKNVILVGHSAGAHTAAMLATAPEYLKNAGFDRDLTAFIGMAGPYDLPLKHELVIEKFTSVTNDIDANPLHLATAAAPPTLLFHGEQDTTAYPFHTLYLAKRLEKLGVPVESHLYHKTDHVALVGALSSKLRFMNPVYADISNYLHKNGFDQACN